MIKALILSGYGLNCEEETAYGFKLSGAKADIIHINDLISGEKSLEFYQILAFPGGFSYGDDTGSGNAYASRIKNNLKDKLINFLKKDRLAIGICNGFQIMVNLGILPGFNNNFKKRQAVLTHNNSARYLVRWVDLEVKNSSPWLKNIKNLSLPIAHGEGRFYAEEMVLKKLEREGQIVLIYKKGRICNYQNLKANPNGSLKNIAGITNSSGKILGLMPHPERALFFHHLPNWPLLKEQYLKKGKDIPEYGPGLKIFKNGVDYFK
jgi:phosphoribosylformylglycinamidine synthase subunit PurQ / glutaminase